VGERGITAIVPESMLRAAAASILLVEGEVSHDMVLELATGKLRIDHPQGTDGRVLRALRKASSVILALRDRGYLANPSKDQDNE